MSPARVYYKRGRSNLVCGKPYDALRAYAKAVQLSTTPRMIETALVAVRKIATAPPNDPAGPEWVARFLLCGLAARFPGRLSRARRKDLLDLVSRKGRPIKSPPVIVAGGCDAGMDSNLPPYREMLLAAFKDFKGTVVSGGTTSGISGLVGEVRERFGRSIRALGYLPASLPRNDRRDARYSEIRRTAGSARFSPLEPIQSWVDILASGIAPSDVKLVGIDGGQIAATEYRMALALGATVGVVEDSGGEAAVLLQDADWCGADNLLPVPADPMTVRAFVGHGNPRLERRMRERIGRGIHAEYLRNRPEKAESGDPSTAEWAELAETLRNSNLQQADDIFAKLRQIKCGVHPVRQEKVKRLRLRKAEVETLAEMEHARWNLERLKDGWRWGSTKDVGAKLSPYLVSWEELPNEVKHWDRQAVRAIPRLLADLHLELRREGK